MKRELLIKAVEMINQVKEFCYDNEIGNILYNEAYKEIEMSLVLNHIHNNGQGPDAINNGEDCEYKTMTGYDGSFQYHWISKEKIEKLRNTPHHYFAVYDSNTNILDKIYYLPVEKIFDELFEQYKKGEQKRLRLVESGNIKKKNTDAHKSFSLKKIKDMGAILVYEK